MKLPPISGLVLIIMLWAAIFAAQGVYAADPKPDMRVLIDISGSMKKTDPENLRVPAAKLLLNLAKDDGRFGVWSFGQYVNNLVPVASVDADWKQQAVSKLDAINSAGLFTNVGLALERATMGQREPDPEWDRTIVLLSDGMVDISKNPDENAVEEQRILQEVIPKLKQAGFRIHAVALSEEADQAFLKSVALKTGGSFSLARNADELLKIFVGASDKANLPEQVPLEGDTFNIDESVKEFTALIFRQSAMKETQLISPDGATFSLSKGSRNVSWFADKQYDLITVYNPAPGAWRVVADLDPSNRVTVVSDLELDVSGLPANVLEGERLTMNMSLQEQGRVITNPNFLELMDITFRQETGNGDTFEGKLSEDANGIKSIPGDGLYSARLGRTITEGEHTFSVIVDGKTFKRKKSVTMTVYKEVLSVETQYRDDAGDVLRYLDVQPVDGLINPETVDIVAQITAPDGEKSIQNAVVDEPGRFRLDIPPTGPLGEYEVLIKVSGTSANGKPFELMQGPYSVDYTPLGMASDVPLADPELPVETFDASAMDIPSLDVEELPPDDIPPLPDVEPVPEPEPVGLDEPIAAEEAVPVEEEGSNWLLMAGVFILGNLLVIGGGVFLYIKFLRSTDEEQSRVVEEITQLQQKKQEAKTPDAAPAPTADSLDMDMDLGSTEMNFGDDEDEATQIRPMPTDEAPAAAQPEPQDTVLQEPAAVAPVVEEPEEPEETYVNEAPPMELEDDEMIEVDDFDDDVDDVDAALDADDGLDDLDMMLSEQEGAEETEEQLNQTIDEMLEQPTVFPEAEPAEADESASAEDIENKEDKKKDGSAGEENIDDKYPGFDHDEFMLDNPTKE